MSETFPFPGSLRDLQIFAIGDIHGQVDALKAVLAQIAHVPSIGRPRVLVSLGDVIDRGPASLKCIDLLESVEGFDRKILLPGNHELMMLRALENHNNADLWLYNGGFAVIDEIIDLNPDITSLSQAIVALETYLGEAYLERLRSGPTYVMVDDLLFVHAGILPQDNRQNLFAYLEENPMNFSNQHWAWVRSPFLTHTGRWCPNDDLVVVHGHTAAVDHAVDEWEYLEAADLHVSHHRINLDAGAAMCSQVGWAEFRGGPSPRYRVCRTCTAPILEMS